MGTEAASRLKNLCDACGPDVYTGPTSWPTYIESTLQLYDSYVNYTTPHYSNCYASDDDDYDEETAALSATVSGLIGGAVALVTLTAAAMWWRSRAAQIRDAKQKMNSQVFYVYEKAEPSESQWPKAPP